MTDYQYGVHAMRYRSYDGIWDHEYRPYESEEEALDAIHHLNRPSAHGVVQGELIRRAVGEWEPA